MPVIDNRRVVDEQPVQNLDLKPETQLATVCAAFSAIYLLLCLILFLWLLNDTFGSRNRFLSWLGHLSPSESAPAVLHTLLAAFIGGALGGIVNELRSFIVWHAERKAFGARFIWKGITAPWVGGSLSLFAIAIVTSGVSVLGAEFNPTPDNPRPSLAVFAIGAMAGYGSREVSKWLDFQVKRVFFVQDSIVIVPSILNKSKAEAEQLLKSTGLELGVVTFESRPNDSLVDIVIKQEPQPNSAMTMGSRVNITISRR